MPEFNTDNLAGVLEAGENDAKNPDDKIQTTEVASKLNGILENAANSIEGLNIDASKKSEFLAEVKNFVKNAVFNQSKERALEKYNTGSFDVDEEKGLDKIEFKNFEDSLNQSINDIIALESFDKFVDVRQDISGDIDKIAFNAQLKKLTKGRSLTDVISDSVTDVSPEEREKLMNAKYGDENFWEGIKYATLHEVPQMAEDIFILAADFPLSIPLMAQYSYYRIRSGHEYDMKVQAMTEAHPAIALVHMLSSTQGIDVAKELFSKIGSPNSWTAEGFVITISSILGLLAGGAGLARGGARLTGKLASKGGKLARMAGKVEKVAGKTQKVLSKGDEIVNFSEGIAQKGIAKVTGKLTKTGAKLNDLGKSGVDKVKEGYQNSPLANEVGSIGSDLKISKKEGLNTNKLDKSSLSSNGLIEKFREAGYKEGDIVRYKKSGISEGIFKIKKIEKGNVYLKEWDSIQNKFKEDGSIVISKGDTRKFSEYRETSLNTTENPPVKSEKKTTVKDKVNILSEGELTQEIQNLKEGVNKINEEISQNSGKIKELTLEKTNIESQIKKLKKANPDEFESIRSEPSPSGKVRITEVPKKGSIIEQKWNELNTEKIQKFREYGELEKANVNLVAEYRKIERSLSKKKFEALPKTEQLKQKIEQLKESLDLAENKENTIDYENHPQNIQRLKDNIASLEKELRKNIQEVKISNSFAEKTEGKPVDRSAEQRIQNQREIGFEKSDAEIAILEDRVNNLKLGDVIISSSGTKREVLDINGDEITVLVNKNGKIFREQLSKRKDFEGKDYKWIDEIKSDRVKELQIKNQKIIDQTKSDLEMAETEVPQVSKKDLLKGVTKIGAFGALGAIGFGLSPSETQGEEEEQKTNSPKATTGNNQKEPEETAKQSEKTPTPSEDKSAQELTAPATSEQSEAQEICDNFDVFVDNLNKDALSREDLNANGSQILEILGLAKGREDFGTKNKGLEGIVNIQKIINEIPGANIEPLVLDGLAGPKTIEALDMVLNDKTLRSDFLSKIQPELPA